MIVAATGLALTAPANAAPDHLTSNRASVLVIECEWYGADLRNDYNTSIQDDARVGVVNNAAGIVWVLNRCPGAYVLEGPGRVSATAEGNTRSRIEIARISGDGTLCDRDGDSFPGCWDLRFLELSR
jgi:hypothetical protein